MDDPYKEPVHEDALARTVREIKEESYKEYMAYLQDAHVSAQKALDLLYNDEGPNRSVWQRMKLGRAQSALISMYVRELAKEGKRRGK